MDLALGSASHHGERDHIEALERLLLLELTDPNGTTSILWDGAIDGSVDFIGSPMRMSRTPVSYRHAPPALGEQTDDILRELLHMQDADIASLRAEGVIGS